MKRDDEDVIKMALATALTEGSAGESKEALCRLFADRDIEREYGFKFRDDVAPSPLTRRYTKP